MNTALNVTDVSHVFPGKQALDHVNFSIQKGELLALLGPNGAGKSTLFALITRLLKIQRGRIAIDGLDLQQFRERVLRGVGVVFQQSTLDPDLTVGQNLAYHAALHGLPSKLARGVMFEELERLNLPDCHNLRVRQLNGGHRRRVEIARALLHRPQLLLLDEATVGLDLESREQLNRHVRELCRERGLSVLWTTHLIDEVEADDQLLILHRGQVRANGNCGALLADAQCSTLRALFAHHTGDKP